MTNAANQLQYGRDDRPAWKKRVRRWYPRLLIGFGVVAVVAITLPPIAHRSELLYLQRLCETYSAPPSLCVYAETPGAVAAFGAQPGYHVWTSFRTPGFPTPVYYVPKPWAEFCSLHPEIRIPPLDRSDTEIRSTPSTRTMVNLSGTLFLHRLRASDGTERLVAIDLFAHGGWGNGGYNVKMYNLVPRILILGTWTVLPTQIPCATAFGIQGDIKQQVRFYAGQTDSTDPSHFTIQVDVDRRPITLDGRLLDHDRIRVSAPGSTTEEGAHWLYVGQTSATRSGV